MLTGCHLLQIEVTAQQTSHSRRRLPIYNSSLGPCTLRAPITHSHQLSNRLAQQEITTYIRTHLACILHGIRVGIGKGSVILDVYPSFFFLLSFSSFRFSALWVLFYLSWLAAYGRLLRCTAGGGSTFWDTSFSLAYDSKRMIFWGACLPLYFSGA